MASVHLCTLRARIALRWAFLASPFRSADGQTGGRIDPRPQCCRPEARPSSRRASFYSDCGPCDAPLATALLARRRINPPARLRWLFHRSEARAVAGFASHLGDGIFARAPVDHDRCAASLPLGRVGDATAPSNRASPASI